MKRFSLFLLTFIVSAMATFAQNVTVTGVVIDEKLKEALPGVAILIKGTSTGVVTDIDGNYSIEAPVGATLVFKYVGMSDKEINVTASTSTLNVALSADLEIEEIQVIGYGTVKKKDNTGSQSTVKTDQITQVASTTFTEGLQGAAVGVNITSSTGEPGASVNVNVRGVHSLTGSSSPLWIIDGVPMTGGAAGSDPMSMINPNDIESIDVLKDAKATAIYGSLGSNGVIIITTKGGGKGKCNTNLNYSYGIGMLPKPEDHLGFANTEEYFKIMDLAMKNAKSATDTFSPMQVVQYYKSNEEFPLEKIYRDEAMKINNNYFDEITRLQTTQDISFSTSCGFEKGDYYVSGAYKKVNGLIKNNEYDNFNTRVNLNFKLAENLKTGVKTSLGYNQNQKISGGTGQSGAWGMANGRALPWTPIYSTANASGYWNPLSGRNPVANLDLEQNDLRYTNYRVISSVYAQWNIQQVEGLSLRSEGGVDVIQGNSVNWSSKYMVERGPTATTTMNINRNMYANMFLNYDRTFNDFHSVNGTIGTETRHDYSWGMSGEAEQLTTQYHYLGSEALPAMKYLGLYSGTPSTDKMRSYFGRADYKFMDKYLIGGSFRRDGSTKFYEDKRWGNFAAASLGWLISEERFFPVSKDILSMMKLRGSIGQTGNKNVSSNIAYATYSSGSFGNGYGPVDYLEGGTRITNLPNIDLTWEKTGSYDFGMDFTLFKNQIEGSIAYYFQDISQLLIASPMPPSAAPITSFTGNIGAMDNSGWEFSLISTNINKIIQRFKWTTEFNFSTNNNEIQKLADGVDYQIRGDKIFYVGQEKNTFYMPEWAGLDPNTGVDQIYEINYDKWVNEGVVEKTGNIIPATKTNMDNNKVILEGKSDVPSYYGGLNNRINYRNFDISLRITFMGGHYLYDYVEHRATNVGNGEYNLSKELLDNAWTPEKRDAKYQKVTYNYNYLDENGNSLGSFNFLTSQYSRYLYRGDFIRLKALEFGYNFPAEITQKMRLSSLRLYSNATNLLTYAFYYKGWDPETGDDNLPPLRTFNFGINVGF